MIPWWWLVPTALVAFVIGYRLGMKSVGRFIEKGLDDPNSEIRKILEQKMEEGVRKYIEGRAKQGW